MYLSVFIFYGLTVLAYAQSEMDRLMDLKIKHWSKMRASGAFNRFDDTDARVMGTMPCTNGKAGEYACENVDMLSFLSHQEMGSTTKEGNDIWGKRSWPCVLSLLTGPEGWTSPDGREFGAVGQTDGTAFVEIDKSGGLRYLGRLPTQTETSPWRDMKVIDGYLYIGSEAAGHGLQVFDMRKVSYQFLCWVKYMGPLTDIDPAPKFNRPKDLQHQEGPHGMV